MSLKYATVQDGVYGIDSDGPPGEKPNQLLIDPGKSMDTCQSL